MDGYAERGVEVADRVSYLSEIHGEVMRLSNVIDRAESELSGILKPEFTGPNSSDTSPKAVQSFLRDTHEGLQLQIDRLVRLIERIEA